MDKIPARAESEPDDEIIDPKSQRRPLKRGETVPHIPTLLEQLEMARVASAATRQQSR